VQVTKSRIDRGKQEILVQWKGLVAADGTWMTLEDFHKVYPSFQLEDELSLQGGGMSCGELITRATRRIPSKQGRKPAQRRVVVRLDSRRQPSNVLPRA
jgi:hypothetical protein